MPDRHALQSLTDDELLSRLSELLRQSRGTESELIAHIGGVDQRRLYAREAAPSMFAYCTKRLHLSEHEAYLRITVARAAREHPVPLALLAEGCLHLSGIAKLAPLLTAVTETLERLEARRFARTKAARKDLAATDIAPASRYVPAAVRRAVYERDAGRCAYTDAHGRRCGARARLEFHHHERPYGRGGEHSVANIRLVCREHNRLQAERDYGRDPIARYRPVADPLLEPSGASGAKRDFGSRLT